MQNFKEVRPIFNVCMNHILPQVYNDSLSYEELLYKILHRLNELVDNNNLLPDYISKLIQEYISSGTIGEVVRNILADYMLNVKNPPSGLKPAKGDGSEDDTEAIQGCIDYANANGGKCIYFPSGKYLTRSLILKDNVSIIGFDRSNTHLVLKGGATEPLLSGITNNNTISRITLDGNMTIQVNDIDVVELTGGNYVFSELNITDGYTLMKLIVNGNIQGNNIYFGKGVIDSLVLDGVGEVNFNNVMFKELSTLSGRYIINNSVNNAVFTDLYSKCVVQTAINNSGNNAVFVGQLVGNVNNITDSGSGTYYDFYSKGSTVQKMVSDEKLAREQADNILQDNIDNEATARTQADNTLQQNIESEKLAREQADTTLQQNIESEKLAREQADNILQENINNEKIAREQADTTLQKNIDDEILKRQQEIYKIYENFSNVIKSFNSMLELKNSTNLKSGDVVQTTGYYNYNDGGSGYYYISNTSSGIYEEIGDLFAILIVENSTINLKQLGAKGDNITNDTIPIQKALDFCSKTHYNCFVPLGRYVVNELYIRNNTGFKLFGVEPGYKLVPNSSAFVYSGSEYCLTLMDEIPPINYYTYHNILENISVVYKGIKGKGAYYCNAVNESEFYNVKCYVEEGTLESGFVLDKSTQITKFINCISSGVDIGFNIIGTENCTINQCNIYNTKKAFNIQYGVGLNITENYIEKSKYAFYFNNSTDIHFLSINICNNSIALAPSDLGILYIETINNNESVLSLNFDNNNCTTTDNISAFTMRTFGNTSPTTYMLLNISNNFFTGFNKIIDNDNPSYVCTTLINNKCYATMFKSDVLLSSEPLNESFKPIMRYFNNNGTIYNEANIIIPQKTLSIGNTVKCDIILLTNSTNTFVSKIGETVISNVEITSNCKIELIVKRYDAQSVQVVTIYKDTVSTLEISTIDFMQNIVINMNCPNTSFYIFDSIML